MAVMQQDLHVQQLRAQLQQYQKLGLAPSNISLPSMPPAPAPAPAVVAAEVVAAEVVAAEGAAAEGAAPNPTESAVAESATFDGAAAAAVAAEVLEAAEEAAEAAENFVEVDGSHSEAGARAAVKSIEAETLALQNHPLLLLQAKVVTARPYFAICRHLPPSAAICRHLSPSATICHTRFAAFLLRQQTQAS